MTEAEPKKETLLKTVLDKQTESGQEPPPSTDEEDRYIVTKKTQLSLARCIFAGLIR